MRISESLRTGTLEILHHKMRSFLTFFAISIGVISIMYSLTLIYSMNFRTRKALEVLGHGRLKIQTKRSYQESTSIDKKEARDHITFEDAMALRANFPELPMVSPVTDSGAQFVYGDYNDWEGVGGITLEWKKRGWIYKVRGRFISQYDIDSYARVCVIIQTGGWFKKPQWMKFYGWKDDFQEFIKHHDLLGKTVQLGDNIYTVVGILESPPLENNPKTFLDLEEWDAKVMVPVTTYQRLLDSGWGGVGSIDAINVDTGKASTVELYKRRMEKTLQARHGGRLRLDIKDFGEIIKTKMADKHRDMYTVLIIGAIAILAGGIGIMNVTLATIYSRIKEIGIRRAIGATRADIMAQFLIEAMLLGFFGGIAGILISMTGIQYLASKGDTDMMMVQWWMPLLSVLAAVLTGFLAALYPALQASKLDPVEALRYE
ncbi:MAG TPA: ABC transporter permease [Elusimicrobiales bacterium]|nr:ABC transporter permease [Elusimicrobiales bacterium]